LDLQTKRKSKETKTHQSPSKFFLQRFFLRSLETLGINRAKSALEAQKTEMKVFLAMKPSCSMRKHFVFCVFSLCLSLVVVVIFFGAKPGKP
jgi:hypothetical protein